MDGVNNAFCMSKEEYEIARLATKCAGLQGKIESQAAEISVLKIAHEAHQTNNLKMLAVLKKQNAEIEKYKKLCDQMGNALELLLKEATHYGETWARCYVAEYERVAIDSKETRFKLLSIYRDSLQAVPEALEAWRAMK